MVALAHLPAHCLGGGATTRRGRFIAAARPSQPPPPAAASSAVRTTLCQLRSSPFNSSCCSSRCGTSGSQRPLRVCANAAADTTADATTAVSPRAQAALDRCSPVLHDYRDRRAALASWLSDFRRAHAGRRPTLADARASGDAALAATFEAYAAARQRLLAEIPHLRQQLEEGGADGHSGGGGNGSGAARRKTAGKHGVVNANAPERDRGAAAGQYFSAVEYRRRVGAVPAAAAAASAAAAATPAPGADSNSNNTDSSSEHLRDAAASAGAMPARMRSAALAALSYRKQRETGAARPAAARTPAQRSALAAQVVESPAPDAVAAARGGAAEGLTTVVETARFDPNAGRRARAGIDADAGLAATMAIGGDVPTAAPAAAPATSARRHATPSPQQPPVAAAAVVLTAKLDPYAGRRRRVEDGSGGALDAFLAGVSGEGALSGGSAEAPATLTAASAAAASSSGAAERSSDEAVASSSTSPATAAAEKAGRALPPPPPLTPPFAVLPGDALPAPT